jgi:hypothetical protein
VLEKASADIAVELAGVEPEAYIQGAYMQNKFYGLGPSDWQSKIAYSDGEWRLECPHLRDALEPFTDLICGEVLFSCLCAHSTIPSHVDDNNYQVTLHLGLSIPDGDCGIEVAGETRIWRQSGCLIFSDSFVHKVWNRTNQPREILLLDLWSPELSPIEISALGELRKILRPASTPEALG